MVNFWLSALLIHLGVSVLAPQNRGFAATLRATAYGFAPMLLAVVPMIGHLLGGLWTLVLQTVAVGQIHRVPALRAVLAVLLPMSLFLLGVFELLPRLLS
jgi:hypothetical protein